MSDAAREPVAPTFERARAAAKQLLRACRAADPSALARVQAQLPRLAALPPADAAERVKLADVQHAFAREAGLESWAALRRFIEAREPLAEQVKRFVRAWHDADGDAMRRVLESHPEVARTSLHTACAACDLALVEAYLARDPALATAPFAGTAWTPLVALAASPLFATSPAHATASVAIAERLFALGAGANDFVPHEEFGQVSKLTALFYASQNGNAPLVRTLLEHGADPNDGESVYHAAEHDHREVLDLLLAHGAEISAAHPRWNNTVLYFLSGYRELNPRAAAATRGMLWLLEHGADPNVPSYEHRETPLHRVAEFRRDLALARALLDHGADPNAARADGRTPLELAVRADHAALVELLRERGGTAAIRPVDQLLGAAARGDLAAARAVLATHPDLLATLDDEDRRAPVRAAENGQADAIRVLAALGFDLGVHGPGESTPLHQAAWRGQVEAVRALLEAGVAIDPRDATYGSSPLAWAAHGSKFCRDADDDYIAVIDLLLAAGATREPSYNHWKEPPENLASDAVSEHLRARGFAPAG